MTGKKYCKVRITYDNDTFIERYRTLKDTGYYRVGTIQNGQETYQEYKGFTNNVPVEVMNVHQMPKISITKNIETHLNKLSQLERPFLITENTNEKAAAIGRITGTNIIDVAIKQVATDIAMDKKLLKNNIKTKTELVAKKNLIDANKLETLKAFYEAALIKITNLETFNSKILELKQAQEDCNNAITQYTKTINECEIIIKDKVQIDEIEELIVNINSMIDLFNKHKQCNDYIRNLNTKIKIHSETIKQKNTIENCNNVISKIQSLMILLKRKDGTTSTIELFKQRIKEYTESISYAEKCKEQEDKIELIRKMIDLYNRNQIIQKNIQENNDESSCALTVIGSLNSELQEQENAMKEYVLSNKICPCCGQKITDKNVSNIISNFFKEVVDENG
jgi:exonuclease SbcC